MPIDLGALGESLQRGFEEIPPVVIALALLAGPTAALIGYRLVSTTRRNVRSTRIEAAPYWVCHDCRSVNELRSSRCYSCGLGRDAGTEVEVIVDAPVRRPTIFDVPAGSPFAAVAGSADHGRAAASGPGVPVMADASDWKTGIPVGPGRAEPAIAVPVVAENGEALLLSEVPGTDDAGGTDDASRARAAERHA